MRKHLVLDHDGVLVDPEPWARGSLHGVHGTNRWLLSVVREYMDHMDENTETPDATTAATAEVDHDPAPSENDLQDADGDKGYDDSSTPDADTMTTFLPHGLRIN